MSQLFDHIVVGAGMAGASVAAELAAGARVLLLEREQQPGYHSTGRSAAAFIPSYGFTNPSLRHLTNASLDFMLNVPKHFSHSPVMHRRGLLTLAPQGQEAAAESEYLELIKHVPNISRMTADDVRQKLPLIRETFSSYAWFEPDVFDIDVHSLQEGYLRMFRHHGGVQINSVVISEITHQDDSWRVIANGVEYRAPVVVNAAGAWSDELAELAGVNKIGLVPLRRTAVLLDPPVGCDVSNWPLVLASDGSFYLKPDAGLILASPADEHPSAPCDAQPEEHDIAYAVHFAQEALDIQVRQVRNKWAGLRNFVADRTPVIGFDAHAKGFFWVTGQGGHGIQTGPAIARLAASLIFGQPIPHDLEKAGFDPSWVSPRRFL
ncbi:MAG: FAD-binding oxidoreductase [Porticoccaceae bacterium]|nr:FAD-binding oxidoreductase [Porticoccaceae bacterium]